MEFNNKAVSPLITIILIVVVAIALTSILLSWGQNFVQTNTAAASDAVDLSCNGADISVISCDYNSVGDTLTFIMVNSGSVDFSEENEFSLILIDDDQELTNKSNILTSAAFNKGESQKIVIEDYDASSPVKMEIRSSYCTGFFRSKTCN